MNEVSGLCSRSLLNQLREKGFHLGTSVLIALAISRGDAFVQESLRFFGAIVFGESLRVHLVTGNVVGIGFEQSLEVSFGAGEIVFAKAFEGDAVAREGVVGILLEEFFQLLAAGFVLCGHVRLAYYTLCDASGPRSRTRGET